MTISNILSSIGLVLDITGVILLWKFGLPENIDRGGAQHLITEQIDESEVKKAKNYDKLSKLAIGVLVAGFAFQALSNFF